MSTSLILWSHTKIIDIMKAFVIIDNGHGCGTAGKCSPDGRYREWLRTRELARAIKYELERVRIEAHLLVPEDEDIDLATRCRRANALCTSGRNAVLVSLHNNAAGSGIKWHTASGWSVFVAPNASAQSRRLATLLYGQAMARGLRGNRAIPKDSYLTANLAICRDTVCPAVLTENMFHDNRQDVDFLMSEQGFRAIVDLHVAAIREYYGI